jgi:CHAT domain
MPQEILSLPIKSYNAETQDLTVLIDYIAVSNSQYRCQYNLYPANRNLKLGIQRFESELISGDAEEFIKRVFNENSNVAKGNSKKQQNFDRLKRIGMHLWKTIFPKDFHDFYWSKLHDKVTSIQFISNEPWIPWELIYPCKSKSKQSFGFFCEIYDLTRWMIGPPDTDSVSLNPMILLVMHEQELDSANAEATAIQNLLTNFGISVTRISNPLYEEICDFLQSETPLNFHLISHASVDQNYVDVSTINLQQGTLSPLDICAENTTFGSNDSLVFFNACETGVGGWAITGIGGWAKAFIDADCGCFIGSMWKVRDQSARSFAVAFYESLSRGQSIGQAARQARLSIKAPDDPTWLSYTVYSNPMTRLATLPSIENLPN